MTPLYREEDSDQEGQATTQGWGCDLKFISFRCSWSCKVSPLEVMPEVQEHRSVTCFLRAALFRKYPLGGRHSVLVTAGDAAQGGCGSQKPMFTHRRWLSTYCTPSVGQAPRRCITLDLLMGAAWGAH